MSDPIIKPFLTWIGSLVFLAVIVMMQNAAGVFENIDFISFYIGIFVAIVAFIMTIVNVFKTQSIFYLIATISILIFYFLMYVY